MRRSVRGVLALGLGFGLTFTAIEIAEGNLSSAPPKGARLGPVDFNGYCTKKYGERAQAVHPGAGAFGWICWAKVNGIVAREWVDAGTVCTEMYNPTAYSNLVDLDDPNGWECLQGPRPEG